MKAKEKDTQLTGSEVLVLLLEGCKRLTTGFTRVVVERLCDLLKREKTGPHPRTQHAIVHELDFVNNASDIETMQQLLLDIHDWMMVHSAADDDVQDQLKFLQELMSYNKTETLQAVTVTVAECYIPCPYPKTRMAAIRYLNKEQSREQTGAMRMGLTPADAIGLDTSDALIVALHGMERYRDALDELYSHFHKELSSLTDERSKFEASKRLAGTYELLAAIDLLLSAFAQVEGEAQVQMLNKETATFDATANLVGVWTQLLKMAPVLKEIRPGVERLGTSNIIAPAVSTMATTQITSMRLDLGKYLAKQQLPPAERLSQYLNVLNSLVEIFPSCGMGDAAKWAKPKGYSGWNGEKGV